MYQEFKDIQKFNYDNRDKNKVCRDCGGKLMSVWYGYSCIECGQIFNQKLEYANQDDLI